MKCFFAVLLLEESGGVKILLGMIHLMVKVQNVPNLQTRDDEFVVDMDDGDMGFVGGEVIVVVVVVEDGP